MLSWFQIKEKMLDSSWKARESYGARLPARSVDCRWKRCRISPTLYAQRRSCSLEDDAWIKKSCFNSIAGSPMSWSTRFGIPDENTTWLRQNSIASLEKGMPELSRPRGLSLAQQTVLPGTLKRYKQLHLVLFSSKRPARSWKLTSWGLWDLRRSSWSWLGTTSNCDPSVHTSLVWSKAMGLISTDRSSSNSSWKAFHTSLLLSNIGWDPRFLR